MAFHDGHRFVSLGLHMMISKLIWREVAHIMSHRLCVCLVLLTATVHKRHNSDFGFHIPQSFVVFEFR